MQQFDPSIYMISDMNADRLPCPIDCPSFNFVSTLLDTVLVRRVCAPRGANMGCLPLVADALVQMLNLNVATQAQRPGAAPALPAADEPLYKACMPFRLTMCEQSFSLIKQLLERANELVM